MPRMQNLNGKLVPLTEAEIAAMDEAAQMTPARLEQTRLDAIGNARAAVRSRIIDALVDADPDYQAAVAAIEKAGTEDEIRAAITVATTK